MKLILFSDQKQTKEVATELTNLIGLDKPTIGYISSCPDPSREFYSDKKLHYAQLGANITPYFDLEEEYNDNLAELVFKADAIHLSGGNTYRFVYWMARRNLQERLLKFAKSDKAIVGVSAGSIIMTPNISYSQFCGDSNDVKLKNLTGLGLVDFYFVPHAVGNAVDRDILYKSRKENNKVIVASDDDWVVVDDSDLRVYGKPKLIIDGEIANIEQL